MSAPEFEALVGAIRSRDNKALADVYTRYRQAFVSWIQRQFACDVEQAKDIYQQSIIALFENAQQGKITNFTSGVKTYLFSIGKNKYYEYLREQERSNKVFNNLRQEYDETEEERSYRDVEFGLSQLGEPCQSLLIQFYYHKQSVEKLTEQFNYKNTDTTKNQKYKCLERLRKLVKEKTQLSINKDHD